MSLKHSHLLKKKVLTEDKWHMSLFLKQDTTKNITTPLEMNAGLQ